MMPLPGDPRVVAASVESLEAELQAMVDRAREFGLDDGTIAEALEAEARSIRRRIEAGDA